MPSTTDKIMFEIYQEESYGGRYRVVYFTELDEHNRESEINAAMAGRHFLDGFIYGPHLTEAREAIERVLERLNGGEHILPSQAACHLRRFLTP